MLIIQICVGSSCHLKGSQDIVELFQSYIEEYSLDSEIVLTGSFCTGKCNRTGVTVTVDDEVCVGITSENFKEFWNNTVMPKVKANRGE